MDRAARKLLVLTGAGVRFGIMQPDEMTIIRDDKDVLIATLVIGVVDNVFALRLDKRTGNAVWSKVGDLLGAQVGWVQYLECR